MGDHDLSTEIIEAYAATYQALQATSVGSWLDLDLSMAQLKTLFVLAREGPAPVGHAAELMGIGVPTASHLIDRLVQLGLAGRSEDSADRRRTLASLTPQGERLVEQLRQGSTKLLRHWLGQLSDADLSALARGLAALSSVVARDGTAASGSDRTLR